MIFSSMEYPGKDYRVQVYDSWLGEELEPMDNPKDGDKIVYRIIGENGQPVEQKTEVYQNGAWVEQGGGGGEPTTIAKATISMVGAMSMNVPYISTQDGEDFLNTVLFAEDSGGEFDVILYNGGAYAELYSDLPFNIAVTGNAELSGDVGIMITGDCTIICTYQE